MLGMIQEISLAALVLGVPGNDVKWSVRPRFPLARGLGGAAYPGESGVANKSSGSEVILR